VIKRSRRLFAALVSIFSLTVGATAYAQDVQTAEATGRVADVNSRELLCRMGWGNARGAGRRHSRGI